jgi:hypothetical protein
VSLIEVISLLLPESYYSRFLVPGGGGWTPSSSADRTHARRSAALRR